MLKIENVEVVGWEHAIRGMRNPKNSWERSDSIRCGQRICEEGCPLQGTPECQEADPSTMIIGPNDHQLMMSLAKGGPVHAKYRRYIDVYFDVVAPLYWWKEFETYRNVVADNPFDIEMNSCSTMHKIHEKEFTLDDFSHEHLMDDYSLEDELTYTGDDTIHCYTSLDSLRNTIDILNHHRTMFLETKDEKYWWQMIQSLPSSYNQRRTLKTSYETLAGMLEWREDHKLNEWRLLCGWIRSLPYSEIMDAKKKEMNYFDFLETLESIAVSKNLRLTMQRAPVGCGIFFHFKQDGTDAISDQVLFMKQHCKPEDLFKQLEEVADTYNAIMSINKEAVET